MSASTGSMTIIATAANAIVSADWKMSTSP